MNEDSVEQDGVLPSPNAGEDGRESPFVLVGIGLSAASLASVEAFLPTLTRAANMVLVVVAQQREALDEERFRVAAERAAGFDQSTAEDGVKLEAGGIYLVPADVVATIEGDRLRLRQAEEKPGERASIDSFFLSLAESARERAVGIVMGGTGGDGSLGITAIREHGGLAIVEDEGAEARDGLASSTHPAALADFLLSPGRMAERLALHMRQLSVARDAVRLASQTPEVTAALAQIAAVLRGRTGHDFHGYKPNTFLRRVQRRMQVVQAQTIEAYVEALRRDPNEPQNLFNDLLIGVTQFFRDTKEFGLLETDVIPRLFEGKGAGEQVRIWVLGCATGEEAYSIGILLREHMAKLDAAPQVQIFATDIDGRALAAARVGRYPDGIAADVSPARLARWFVKEGNTYAVAKELREMCIFSGHNVIKDPPFSRLDLVSCRNLLIYLNADLQAGIMPLFHFALRPNGFLFLGNSENVTRHGKLFAPIDRRARIFRRIETTSRVLPGFPLSATSVRRAPADGGAQPRPASLDRLARRAEQIVERHAPAYIIVDEQFDVVHFSGRTGRYLDPPSGTASLNVLNLVHRDLRHDLQVVLQTVLDGPHAARIDRVRMGTNGGRLIVDLAVETLQGDIGGPRHFVVVFKDGFAIPDTEDDAYANAYSASERDEHVRRLEAELRTSRDRLQAMIEELESTNEELKSSNEEYQSLNEELQSANEELETSKEELQSVNEELTTVNGELAQRVHELARTNSDLKNFLESTQIATVFLDNDLRLMNYTPTVTEIFPLIDGDLGRPIDHIKARIPLDELQEDVRRVIRTLGTVEREIDVPATGGRYIVRVLPYRSIDNFIAGAVVTFLDISPLTRAEQAMRESEKRFRDLAELSPDGLLITVDDNVVYANDAAARLFGAAATDDLKEVPTADFILPDPVEAAVDRLADMGQGDVRPRAEAAFRRLDGTTVMLEATVGPVAWHGRKAVQVLLRDVGERKRAEERQRRLLAELQHRVRNTLAVLRSIARRTAASSATVEDYSAHLDGRFAAFARVQAAVTRDPAAGVDLGQLLADELLAYQAREGEQVTVEGPPTRLQPKAAETFALAIHELATNAVKYGVLAQPGGRLAIRWQRDQETNRLVFSWEEHGNGPIEAPTRRGFGTELLERTLSFELKARTILDYGGRGLRCVIELPLTPAVFLMPLSS